MEDQLLPSSVSGASISDCQLLILSEGLFNHNNSSLTTIKDGVVTTNCFQKVNHRGLGDTANDMIKYGSKIYIAVNVSSTLEVIDAQSLKTLAQIPFVSEDNTPRQPRYSIGSGKYIYTCSFDGSVCRTDTSSFKTEFVFQAGLNPDGIAIFNDRLYISNSGGLFAPDYDNTLSAFNLRTCNTEDVINIGINPGKLMSTSDYLAILTRGNYSDIPSSLQIMDRQGNISHIMDGILNYTIHNDDIYAYTEKKLYRISLLNHSCHIEEMVMPISISEENLIRPYAITVDNNYIYMSDAKDYTTLGDIYIISKDLTKYERIQNIGLNPNTILIQKTNIKADDVQPTSQSCRLTVIDYSPAPGQFINTSLSAYPTEGMNYNDILIEATRKLNNNELISLGSFGGSITVKLETPIKNCPDKPDFMVMANAIFSTSGNSSEPGVIEVSTDGIIWYEIYGSAHTDTQCTYHYSIYYKLQPDGTILWEANDGTSGEVARNTFHTQPYFPEWLTENELTVTATRLPNVAYYDDTAKQWQFTPFSFGYADNMPNNSDANQIDIDWAHDAIGNPIHLDSISYLRVTTAVHQTCGILGEVSTEISGIKSINNQ